MKTAKIVITNDDGIESPGLKAAAMAASPLGDLTVIAPTRQGTSMGRSMRGGKQETLHPIGFEIASRTIPAYHLDASPAMAVKHGLDILFPDVKPDLVISGINYGENLGVNITHSGTVGAALQAASRGVPAIAASIQTDFHYHFNYGELNWDAAVSHVRRLSELLLTHKMPDDLDVVKIDVPATATAGTAWRLTRLSRQPYYKSVIENPSLSSRIGDARLRIEIDFETLEPDSDIHAFAVEKVVAITPLSVDLTSRATFSEITTLLGLHN